MAVKRSKKLKFFDNHDAQERLDLRYGQQQPACAKLADRHEKGFRDHSTTRDWKPETD
jgi:hypothetical protein